MKHHAEITERRDGEPHIGEAERFEAGASVVRRRVARRYNELLADTPLRLPVEADYAASAYHLYVVRHPQRDEIKQHLEQHGIGCALHYPLPLHLQKCYADLGYKSGAFPVAEKAARQCLSLPIYPELTEVQIQRVAAALKEFFGKG